MRCGNARNNTDTAANTDFALVTLAQPVGNRTGWLGLEWNNGASVTIDLITAGTHSASMRLNVVPAGHSLCVRGAMLGADVETRLRQVWDAERQCRCSMR